MLDIDVIILAGGQGTRLASIVPDRPKVLAEVCGRPFLQLLLSTLRTYGVSRVILSVGYMGDMVEEVMGASFEGIALEYSFEPWPLGTGGALRHAAKLIRTPFFMMCNGDSWCLTNPVEIVSDLSCNTLEGGMVITHVPNTSRFGTVEINDVGDIIQFGQKQVGSGPGWINAGIYFLRREIIRMIPNSPEFLSFERDILPIVVGRGFRAFPARSEFIDIGVPETYAIAGSFFENNRSFSPSFRL
jgi:NDP-sugar pyrophosphorylase family protein